MAVNTKANRRQDHQVNRVLSAETFDQMIFTTTGLEQFTLDSSFKAGLAPQKVVGNMARDGHVLRSMDFAHPALVLPADHVHGTIQAILNPPIIANGLRHWGARRTEAADIIAGLASLALGHLLPGLYFDHRLQPNPLLPAGAWAGERTWAQSSLRSSPDRE